MANIAEDNNNNNNNNIVQTWNDFHIPPTFHIGTYPRLAEMYCGNIQVLDPGQPLPQNNLILNIVDLRGNMIKIHRDAATTVQQLHNL